MQQGLLHAHAARPHADRRPATAISAWRCPRDQTAAARPAGGRRCRRGRGVSAARGGPMPEPSRRRPSHIAAAARLLRGHRRRRHRLPRQLPALRRARPHRDAARCSASEHSAMRASERRRLRGAPLHDRLPAAGPARRPARGRDARRGDRAARRSTLDPADRAAASEILVRARACWSPASVAERPAAPRLPAALRAALQSRWRSPRSRHDSARRRHEQRPAIKWTRPRRSPAPPWRQRCPSTCRSWPVPAGRLVVKLVMLLLLLASFWSWAIIFEKVLRLRRLQQAAPSVRGDVLVGRLARGALRPGRPAPDDPMTRDLRRRDARMAPQRRQGPARHRQACAPACSSASSRS